MILKYETYQLLSRYKFNAFRIENGIFTLSSSSYPNRWFFLKDNLGLPDGDYYIKDIDKAIKLFFSAQKNPYEADFIGTHTIIPRKYVESTDQNSKGNFLFDWSDDAHKIRLIVKERKGKIDSNLSHRKHTLNWYKEKPEQFFISSNLTKDENIEVARKAYEKAKEEHKEEMIHINDIIDGKTIIEKVSSDFKAKWLTKEINVLHVPIDHSSSMSLFTDFNDASLDDTYFPHTEGAFKATAYKLDIRKLIDLSNHFTKYYSNCISSIKEVTRQQTLIGDGKNITYEVFDYDGGDILVEEVIGTTDQKFALRVNASCLPPHEHFNFSVTDNLIHFFNDKVEYVFKRPYAEKL